MKTQVVNRNRREATDVVATIQSCIEKYKGTKLAFWCGKFLRLNTDVLKEHDKKMKKLTATLLSDFEDAQIDLCLEKEGRVWLDEKSNYQYSKDNQKKIVTKRRKLNEDVEKATNDFLDADIRIRVFRSPITLPEELTFAESFALDGYVYTSENIHEEALEELTAEPENTTPEKEEVPA